LLDSLLQEMPNVWTKMTENNREEKADENLLTNEKVDKIIHEETEFVHNLMNTNVKENNGFSYETQFISFIKRSDSTEKSNDDDAEETKDEKRLNYNNSEGKGAGFAHIPVATAETVKVEESLLSKHENVPPTSEASCEKMKNINQKNIDFDESDPKEEPEVKIEICEDESESVNSLTNGAKQNTGIKTKVDVDSLLALGKKENNFQCEHCIKVFSLKKHMNEHVRSVHEGIRNFECGFCDKKFFKKYEKTKHERKHTGEKPHQCQICGDSFKQKLTFDEHMTFHSGIQEFQCIDCGKQFGLERSLRHHRLLRHTHQLPCNMCDKKFSTKSHLERHVKGHLGIKDSQCVDCGKQFASNRSLKQHMANEHLDQKPENQEVFTCPVCGKLFKYVNNMKTHMKTHSESHVKVQCNECGKHYKTERILKDHIRIIHMGKSRHKCEICGKAFGRLTALEVHQTTHAKPYQCEICNQGYKTQSSMAKHMQQEHTGLHSI